MTSHFNRKNYSLEISILDKRSPLIFLADIRQLCEFVDESDSAHPGASHPQLLHLQSA